MESNKRVWLLDKFWEVQRKEGYLSDKAIADIADEFGLTRVETEGVATFYHFFHRQQAGIFTIYLNNSALSVCNGFEEVKKAFEAETGAKLGSTDASGSFGFFETSCIGLGDCEPAALINFFPFTNLTPSKVKDIIDSLKGGKRPDELCDPVEEKVYLPEGSKGFLFADFIPFKALEITRKYSPDEVLEIIKDSELTGRGGAFFPTGMKWELARKAAGKEKFIVCNADEGEPGSFKDRALLRLLPELMVEGMIMAAYAVGATEGIIYLRAEYCWILPRLEKALEKYRREGWLGKMVLQGLQFDIRIQIGAGAYICGEETALLESLEGKRGEPRVKTFFPTDKGYLEKPTVINNVETFCAVARIIEFGAEKFKSLGVPKSRGTKLLSVSGDCGKRGVYEIEWGMKVQDLLEMAEAEDPRFIQMSGPSGELISVEEKDRVISCDDIRCEGSVMIFNTQRDLLSILQNYLKFFTYESCGICTPCRAGNPQLLRMVEKLIDGSATGKDLDSILNWSAMIMNNSRCGLGKTAPNSLVQTIRKFPELLKPRLKKEDLFNPSFDLNKATADFNQLNYGK